jgi:hypothetical protein
MPLFRSRSKASESWSSAVQLLEDLAQAKTRRVPIYLNETRIKDAFKQSYQWPAELQPGGTKGIEGTVGLPYAASVKGSAATTIIEKKDLDDPLMQLVLMEASERREGRLIDLSLETTPQVEGLHKYIGRGRIFMPWDVVEEDASIGLSAESAGAIQEERARKEAVAHRLRQLQHGDIVWVAAGRRLASIAGMQWVERNKSALERFTGERDLGIIGDHEQKVGDVTLLTPFGIWYER